MEQILETGSGLWAPLAWTLAFAVAMLIGWLIRNIGDSGCQEGTEQTKVFISAEDEDLFEEQDVHIVGGNLLHLLAGNRNQQVVHNSHAW